MKSLRAISMFMFAVVAFGIAEAQAVESEVESEIEEQQKAIEKDKESLKEEAKDTVYREPIERERKKVTDGIRKKIRKNLKFF